MTSGGVNNLMQFWSVNNFGLALEGIKTHALSNVVSMLVLICC